MPVAPTKQTPEHTTSTNELCSYSFMSRSYNTELLSCQKRMCEMWKFTYYIPLNELCGFRVLINTNCIEVLVTIFYRGRTLNKLKFDLIKKHSSDLCKRNKNKFLFIVHCSRENSTKFREISPRHFVKALANFRQTKFRRHLGEISHPLKRNFVLPKFRRSENSYSRNFAG